MMRRSAAVESSDARQISTRPRRAAFTHAEIILAMALLLAVAVVAYEVLDIVDGRQNTLRAALDGRQQAQALSAMLATDIASASYVFQGWQGCMDGTKYNVPPAGSDGTTLIYLIPEADPAVDERYTVVGIQVIPRSPLDPLNPQAHSVSVYRKEGARPRTAGQPESVDLDAIRGGVTTVYDAYVPPGAFHVRLQNPANCVTVTFAFERCPPRGLVEHEDYCVSAPCGRPSPNNNGGVITKSNY